MSEFYYEVGYDLSFDGGPWLVLDIKLAQLNSPQRQSTSNFRIAHRPSQGLVGYDVHRMGLKVWLELASRRD